MTTHAKAQLRMAHVAPRKARLLIDLIRGMKADEAKLQLLFSKKRVSTMLAKLLDSAVANAVNNHGMKPETLVVEKAFVDGGPIMYRYMPRAQGRAGKIRKRTAHITIVLAGEAEEVKKKTPKKKAEPVAETDEKKPVATEKETKKVKKTTTRSKKKTT